MYRLYPLLRKYRPQQALADGISPSRYPWMQSRKYTSPHSIPVALEIARTVQSPTFFPQGLGLKYLYIFPAVIVEQFVCSHQFSQPFFIILCCVFITNICGARFAHSARPQTVNVFFTICNHGESLPCSAFIVSQKPPFKVAGKGQKSAQKRRGSN